MKTYIYLDESKILKSEELEPYFEIGVPKGKWMNYKEPPILSKEKLNEAARILNEAYSKLMDLSDSDSFQEELEEYLAPSDAEFIIRLAYWAGFCKEELK